MNGVFFSSACRKDWISEVSLPPCTTLKFSLRFFTRASSLVTYDGSPSSNWPLSPDSEVLKSEAYLLRFFQSVMSGYFFAIHGGTNQPMTPLFPVCPASTAVFCWVMYFFFR